MPRVDVYGTQQPIALLRQVVERRGMYDRGRELGWRNLKDVQVLGAMGPPGGARSAVDPRFASLFSVFEIETPSSDNLRAIYRTILGGHVAGMPEAVGVLGACALGESK
jgi:dynein heavy chain